MENNTIEREEAMIILTAFIIANNNEYTAKWMDFSEKVKSNDSIDNHEIFQIIKNLKDECIFNVLPNTELFRARGLRHSEIKELYQRENWQNLFEKLKKEIPISLPYNDINDFIAYLPLFEKYYTETFNILTGWGKEQEGINFWGFDRNGSGSNKKWDSSEGRLNITGQHHLYLAEDIDTAIHEIRAINEQLISIATIKTLKNIKVFDFCKKFDLGAEEEIKKSLMLDPIARECSKPNHGDENYYKPTQVVSNYIKALGFDGIRYPSSLKKDGKNIIIFDDFDIQYEENPTNATLQITGSKVYQINGTQITSSQYLPFESIGTSNETKI